MNANWSARPENRRIRYRAAIGREYGLFDAWECPECKTLRRTSETLRAHRQLAHDIPSEIQP